MTAPELMPCLWCGGVMRPAIFSVVCSNVGCTYRYRTFQAGTTCEEDLAASVEFHNTLARQAEIGRLVEKILDAQCDIDTRLFVEVGGGPGTVRCVGLEDQFSRITGHAGVTLLDALRSLAAEVSK